MKSKEREKAMEIFDIMTVRILLNLDSLNKREIMKNLIEADIKLQKLFFNRDLIDVGGIYYKEIKKCPTK